MIVTILLAVLAAWSGAATAAGVPAAGRAAAGSAGAASPPLAPPSASRAADSTGRSFALDTVVTLPEVRVESERPARGARSRVPTGFATDVAAGVTGHALETLAEALALVPGVRVLQYGGLGAFSTVSLRGAPAGQVSVFLDGAPLTSAARGVVNLSDLPVTAVERIEVYRGVSPLSLGAATPGGAVHLVSGAPRGRLDARLARGSFDTWDGRATGGIRRGRLRAMLHAGYQGSAGDFRYLDDNGTPLWSEDDGISTRVNNRFEAASALATLAFEPARGVSVTARENLFRKTQGVPGLGAVPAHGASLETSRSTGQLEIASAPRGLVPGARLAGAVARERTRSRDLGGKLGLGRHDTDDRIESDQLTLTFETQRLGAAPLPGAAPAGVLSLEAAGSLRSERAELHDAADGLPDPPGSERTTRGVSLALQLRPLRDRVVLHAARRWDRIEDRLRSVSSLGRPQSRDVTREIAVPQLGARVGIGFGLEAMANWTRAERPPDFMELFGNQGSVHGNPALRPERGESWDAGVRWAGTAAGFTGGVEWSHFESDTRDVILYVKNSQSSVRALNVTRGVIRGEELAIRAGTPWGLDASAAATVQDARDRGPVAAYQGKHLPQRPEAQVNARIEFARGRMRLGSDLDFLAENYLDQYNTKYVSSRTLVGAWLSVAPLGEHLRFTIEGKNLGDRHVSDVGGFPLPGRSLFVSCETRFARN